MIELEKMLENYVAKDYQGVNQSFLELYSFQPPRFDPPKFEPISQIVKPVPRINQFLEGNVFLNLKKSTSNTYILEQNVEGLDKAIARYIHHDRGPGRED